MGFDAFLWILLPAFVAAGSALLAFFVMQARLEVAVAKEREEIAHLRAQLSAQQQLMEDRIRKTEEETLRRSFENFLADIRVEERHYMKEQKVDGGSRKAMVLQERMFFRNIPLSNWVEHEMTVEEDGDLRRLAQAASIFTASLGEAKGPVTDPKRQLTGTAPRSNEHGSRGEEGRAAGGRAQDGRGQDGRRQRNQNRPTNTATEDYRTDSYREENRPSPGVPKILAN